MGDDYRRLIAGTQSKYAFSAGTDRSKHDNMVWSRVLSMPHFTISGVTANELADDLEEAQDELVDAKRVYQIVLN